VFRSGQPFRGFQLPDIPGAICPSTALLGMCLWSFFGVSEMNEIFAVAGVAALMMAFLFFVLPTLSMKAR
jgi:hypothetical protein